MIAMLKNNKKIVIGGAAIVIVAALVVNAIVKKPKEVVDTTPIEEQKTEDVQPAPSKPRVVTKTPVVVDNRTYTDLVTAYKGRTVQFNEQCQVPLFPQVVFKVGTDILLDNRGPKNIQVTLAGTSYSLPGYGFKVVSLDSAGTIVVDCNTQQNVAVINVQK